MIFEDSKEYIKNNYLRHKSGKINYIDLGFDRFGKVFPGIQKARYICISAAPGVSKTRFAKFYFVFNALLHCHKNKIPVKFIFFCLEESKHAFICSVISMYLFHFYSIRCDYNNLNSITKDVTLNEQILNILDSEHAIEFFEYFEECCDIVDYLYTPSQMHSYVMDYAQSTGKFYNKHTPVTYNDNFTSYRPVELESYTILLYDHVSLVEPEQGCETLHKAMSKLSKNNMFYRDILGYTPINIHQQSASEEDLDHIEKKKIMPSGTGLADNKLLYRDYDICLGLCSPKRYGITNFLKYNISQMGDNFRALNVFKNRYGISDVAIGLFFDGATLYHEEMPEQNDIIALKNIQEKVKQLNN